MVVVYSAMGTSAKAYLIVIPAKAGIQNQLFLLDSRLRVNDGFAVRD